MEIREAKQEDKPEIISLYQLSQSITGLPNPAMIPNAELGVYLYSRPAIARYVATEGDQIVGHGLLETPNPRHMERWIAALGVNGISLIEMGGAFVDPYFTARGIWTALLRYRLEVIRSNGHIPVTTTWSINEHVKKTLLRQGAINAGQQTTEFGDVDLFVFKS